MESSSSVPSSPLSNLSRSPSPPLDYPSPSSSTLCENGPQSKENDAPGRLENDEPPPAKKRKVVEPKERKTEYLNLRHLYEGSDEEYLKRQHQQLQRLVKILRKKRKIVVIAGAGISVSAGIPDFRSSTGLFKTLRNEHKLKASGKHLFDASVYRNDSSTSSFHEMVRGLSHLTQKAKPTPFHHMLATLAEEGRLLRLYSQNVDGIDTSLEPLATTVPLNPKGPWPKTIQLHGGLEKMVCTKCGKLSDFDGTLFEGPEPPSCPECEANDIARVAGGLRSHGIGRLRPRMVLYNEFNPDEEAIGAVSHADLKTRPDAVIVVGTSLKVPGIRRLAREMCAVARGRRDGFTAWINFDPEPVGVEFKDCWDLVVRGECDEVARHVALPKWDDKDIGEYALITDEQRAKGQLAVEINSKPLDVLKNQGFLTPGASPRQQSPAPMLLPVSKLKQPQLSFISQNIPPREKSDDPSKETSKITGKPKRKYTKKDTAPKPTNKITSTFKTAKLPKPTGTKDRKPLPSSPVVLHRSEATSMFPNLTNPPQTPMQKISPAEVRNNTNVSPYSSPLSELCCTPPRNDETTYNRRETISPKGGLPSGMAHLLD
ncbi:DHS-like NAD/FAD-binding domain-containing protein [Xylogone sp. PMI_703]|nr:DHS-like NAD/FAD-binding domain-containing protein [Xylogone sp. PMI_703]